MTARDQTHDAAHARDLLDFIDASPSPWHAVANIATRLAAQGFVALDERARWQLAPGGRYYVVRGGAIVAFVRGTAPLAERGLRMIGAHTDSPGLRLKPKAAHAGDGLLRLAVEVYGGPLLATFADRDLGLAGRVVVRTADGQATRLLRFAEAVARLPNLAIHMNRDANEQGLKFNKQTELPLICTCLGDGEDAETALRKLLAAQIQADAADLLGWDILAHDLQAGSLWGGKTEFIASRQLDNLASCHAALSALLATAAPASTALIALFDHEEIGSESAVGAGGRLIDDVLARLAQLDGLDEQDRQRMLAHSFCVSADMAHAYHPNFPAAYEPGHHVAMNGGPVVKCNANQRYVTDAAGLARFKRLCEQAGVRCQEYAHRSDLGCGSTIGPQLAARLGIAAVDVGAPLWAMHSARESAGVHDHADMIAVLTAMLADTASD